MVFPNLRVELVKSFIDLNEHFFFEKKMKAFYKSIDMPHVVIDVGANKGQSIDFFLKINPECKIFAIEPNRVLFNLLIKKYSGNKNIKLFNFGISDVEGEKLFNENVLDYTSTFETLNVNSEYLKKKTRILGVTTGNIITKSYNVKTLTLSKFIQENLHGKTIDVLKIDTEGHEYHCLTGLFNEPSSSVIKYIQMENHNDDMYENSISFIEINRLLNINKYCECAKIKHGFGDFDEVVYCYIT